MKIKVKKIYKYGTGDTIPRNAEYLYSWIDKASDGGTTYVWHYFLVEVEEELKEE